MWNLFFDSLKIFHASFDNLKNECFVFELKGWRMSVIKKLLHEFRATFYTVVQEISNNEYIDEMHIYDVLKIPLVMFLST